MSQQPCLYKGERGRSQPGGGGGFTFQLYTCTSRPGRLRHVCFVALFRFVLSNLRADLSSDARPSLLVAGHRLVMYPSHSRTETKRGVVFHFFLHQNDRVTPPETRSTVEVKRDSIPATHSPDSPTAKQTTPPPPTNRFNLSLQLPGNQHQGLYCLSGGNKTLPL